MCLVVKPAFCGNLSQRKIPALCQRDRALNAKPEDELMRRYADEFGHSRLDMLSVAGHDAYFMARHCPSCMMFVPSRGGITHHNKELSVQEETEPGANVFLHSVVAHADR